MTFFAIFKVKEITKNAKKWKEMWKIQNFSKKSTKQNEKIGKWKKNIAKNFQKKKIQKIEFTFFISKLRHSYLRGEIPIFSMVTV